MIQNHPRSRESHYLTDLFSLLRFITVYLTVGAEGFALHKWAVVRAVYGVEQNFPAVGTQIGPMMPLFAIKPDHLGNDPFFLFPLVIDGFHGGGLLVFVLG